MKSPTKPGFLLGEEGHRLRRMVASVRGKPIAARVLLTLGMTALWIHVFQFILGYGFSPIIVGIVLGYGLTDRLVDVASGK